MICPTCGHTVILSHPWTLRLFQHLRIINSPHPLPFPSQIPLEWVRTPPCPMSGRLCRLLGSSHTCSGAARHARASQKVRATQKVKSSAPLTICQALPLPHPSGHKRRCCELGRPKAVPGVFLMRWRQLRHPWDSLGKNTGVGCHFLLQCMKVKSEGEVAQSCPTLRDSMDFSLPGSSLHGSFQARVLEWGAIDANTNQIKAGVVMLILDRIIYQE